MNPTERQILTEDAWRFDPARFAERMSKGKWLRYAWVKHLSEQIRLGIFNGSARYVIEAPPRHGKSEFVSVWLVIWYLSMFPDRRVMIVCHGEDLAKGFSRRVRDFFRDHPEFGAEISPHVFGAGEWETTDGGGCRGVGVKGSLTGKGAHLMVLDDLIKGPEQAFSQTYRDGLIALWQSTLESRLEPGASVICMNTRWHFRDPAGYLLSEESGEQFTELRYPALAEPHDILGRDVGEPLCPERFPLAELERKRKINGGPSGRFWLAIYQQKPAATGGDIIREKDVRFWYIGKEPERWSVVDEKGEYVECNQVELPGTFDGLISSWDATFKGKKTSDNVAGHVWAWDKASRFLLDRMNDKMGFRKTKASIKVLHGRWPGIQAHLIEDKANGPAIIEELTGDVPGILPINPLGSKDARLESVSPLFESGCIYLPHPRMKGYQWVHEVIVELTSFPAWEHDDDVDACTQALTWIRHKDHEDRADEWSGLY